MCKIIEESTIEMTEEEWQILRIHVREVIKKSNCIITNQVTCNKVKKKPRYKKLKKGK